MGSDARMGCRLPCCGSGGAVFVMVPNRGWRCAGEMRTRGEERKFWNCDRRDGRNGRKRGRERKWL